MDNRDEDIKNLNDDSTMYFGEDRNYESHTNPPYTEDDMYENYTPMTNINSVEYDENDYESNNYDEDVETENNRSKIIIGYIITLVLLVIIILVALLK